MNKQFTRTIHGILLLSLISLSGCEKNEVVVQSDGNTFCPLQFRCYKEIGILEGCGFENYATYDPVFSSEADGLMVDVSLKKYNTPFIAADPSPTGYNTYRRAVNLTNAFSKHRIVFDKILMTAGTRTSLYIGKTYSQTPDILYPVLGNISEDIPAGPSPKHNWQIFIQRETDETYTFGYIAQGDKHIVQSGISDFTTADFEIENATDHSSLRGQLTNAGATIASFDTQNEMMPLIPNRLFGAFGFNIIDPLQFMCDIRPISVKLKNYTYRSINAGDNYEDHFSCNTIWLF